MAWRRAVGPILVLADLRGKAVKIMTRPFLSSFLPNGAVLTCLVAACTQMTGPEEPAIDVLTLASSIAPVQAAPASGAMMDHSHIPVEVPAEVATPSLSLSVSRDWMAGLNLELHVADYELRPPPSGLDMAALMQPSINTETGLAEGHAHLYINGLKVQRIYGPNVHLPEALFKPGLNQINVSINNHGHMYWTADGRQIMATLFINLDNDELITHRFESYPVMKSADGSMCVTGTILKEG